MPYRVSPAFPLVAVVLLTGCPEEPAAKNGTTTGGKLFAGRSVVFSAPAGLGFSAEWEGPLAEWGVQTGAEGRLVEREVDDALPSQLKGAEATLAAFPIERTGELLAAGVLAQIPDAIARDPDGIDWPDLLPGLRDAVPSRERHPLFVPLACPVLLCYYRADLLKQAGLSPPQTWDDYQKLVETLDDWAPGLSAVEPCDESFRATLFLARALAYAKHPGRYSVVFDIDSGAPLIDNPAFVRALETAARAWSQMPAEIREMSAADCRRKIIDGTAALAIAFEAPASAKPSAMSAGEARPERAAVGFCRLPGVREFYNPTQKIWERPADKGVHQVTLVGFSGWAVGASAAAPPPDVEAAWNALVHLGNGAFVAGFPSAVVGFCRESQLGDAGLLDDATWRGEESSTCLDAIATSLRDRRVVLELPVPRRQEFLAALGAGIGRVLSEEATPEAALQQVSSDWQKLVKSIGLERLRDTYRQALGLSPFVER